MSDMANPSSAIKDLRIHRPARSESAGRGWLIIFFLLLIAAIAGAGGWWLMQPKALVARTAIVREATAGAATDRTVLNASGYVVARREATVSSKVTGKVQDVLVEEGMRVSKDQVLAHLDPSNVVKSLALADAQLSSAHAMLAETKVRIEEAEKEWRRERELVAKNVAMRADYDKAEAALLALRAKLIQQQADVSVAEKTLDSYRQQYEDTIIRAPFSGIVTSKNAQPGEMISPMSSGGFTRTGICTIVDMDSLEIEVDVNESYINRVKPGQPAEAALDAYPEWKIACKVIAIIPTADRQKSTVRVRVAFEKLEPRILPEMSVKVAFRETEQAAEDAPAKKAAVLPAGAVFQENGRDIVFVLTNGKAERRAVTVASRTDEEVVLIAGASPGERVLVERPAGLTDGSPVQEAN